jgi:flagellar basal body-associated protein FliL
MAEEKSAPAKDPGPEKETQPKEKTEAAVAGQKKIMFWGIIGGLVVLEVVIMFFVIKLTQPKSPQEAAAAAAADSMKVAMQNQTEMGSTTKATDVITNVAGTDGDRFLKCSFVLEYQDPDAAKGKKGGGEGEKSVSKTLEELTRRMPKFKNMLIDLLASKTLTELNEPNTKENIRKDFMRNINSSLPGDVGKVTDVLFEQFIIQ